MCISAPGKIERIDGSKALLKYSSGDERWALIGGEDIKVGDYVSVQMGIIIKVLTRSEAESSISAWKG